MAARATMSPVMSERVRPALLDRLVPELDRGEDRPPRLDVAAAAGAEIFRLQRDPARIEIGRHDLLQGLVIGIVAHADQRRQQAQLAEKTDVRIHLDARRIEHFLAVAIVSSTSFDCQCMSFGNGDSVPRIHST